MPHHTMECGRLLKSINKHIAGIMYYYQSLLYDFSIAHFFTKIKTKIEIKNLSQWSTIPVFTRLS